MYARYLTFKSGPENRAAIEAVADAMFGYVKTLNGFVSIHYLISDDENEYGSFSLWASREDADNAGIVLGEKLGPMLEGKVSSPPTVVTMEIYKPG